jgi:hypothetical protein
LPLRWAELLHLLGALQDAPALLGRHIVELREAVAHALLGLRGEIAETGLIFERVLLLCKWKIAVMIHPLRQVLLIRLRTDLSLPLSRVPGRPLRLTYLVHRRRLSRNHRCGCQ